MGSNSSQPLGMFQRLINYIMSKLVRPTTPPDSEIIVEFMHTDGPKNCTQTDECPNIVVQKGSEEKEKHQEISAPNSHQKNGSIIIGQGKGLQEVEALTAKNKGTKKSVTFKEDEKKEANNNLLSADEAKKANSNGSHEETKEKPPRHWGPLLSVASNINEKSDAFIKRRKKAMRRNYTLDPDKS